MPQPGNEGRPPHRIREIWAWVCQAPDGDEGLPAHTDPVSGLTLPLVGADPSRRDSLVQLARIVHQASHQRMELRRFVFDSVEEVLD